MHSLLLFILLLILPLAINAVRLVVLASRIRHADTRVKNHPEEVIHRYLEQLDSGQIRRLLEKAGTKSRKSMLMFGLVPLQVVQNDPAGTRSLLGEGGILITILLIMIPLVLASVLLTGKIIHLLKKYRAAQEAEEAASIAGQLENIPVTDALIRRQKALDFRLTNRELSGDQPPEDTRGLIHNIERDATLPIVARKKRAIPRPGIDPELSRLILWMMGCATFWLLFGTTVGEYLGIKFVAPEADQQEFLSFGRLRPVHTNSVFWGWASLAMLSLAYYVVPRVGNTAIFSKKLGWYSLILVNASVAAGTLCLMAGINNGGGEYREYIWPVMLPFALALVLTFFNFFKTIGRRTTREIYISNWYIVSALIFAVTIVLVAYLPFWQNGLGETIVQGYYMHQGVGMWFMFFTLGIVYYFLPQQLNKPVYSYSLGILAFWTQILFYTLIGTHHFVFSSIPWWLQTVAIVGSVGMVIPVVAGTANFLLTFNGAWHKLNDSYTLPFFLTGVVFYFTGSMQGTAEAFRSTNLIWHFTDFTVAHSHLTMYGIISFLLWGGIYALVPRLTGLEPPQLTVGVHFWLALIGLMFYTVPLMYGSTLRGLMWQGSSPFIDSVVMMAPYWLWRAIGGSLMWLSHLFFAYNFYRMLVPGNTPDFREKVRQHLEAGTSAPAQTN